MSMWARAQDRFRRRKSDERGAYAVLMTFVVVLVIALAAISLDIAKQVESKQSLRNTMDSAAQAAAYSLPDVADAKAQAQSTAWRIDPSADPDVSMWCVVKSNGAARTPDQSQIPGTCNPDTRIAKPITAAKIPGLICDETLCFIPCSETHGKCNTIRLEDEETVPYDFAPLIGYNKGSTGSVVTVACKGSCGTAPPNPMDVVVVADRTQSLTDSDRGQMVSAIQGMLRSMDPSMHFVSLATIDKSRSVSGTTCPSTPRTQSGASSDSWLATPFSANYSYLDAHGQRILRTGSTDKVAQGVSCLAASQASWGTHLSAPLKAAARTLLGTDASNLASLNQANPRAGDVTKVIIFETDGEPNEKSETVNGVTTPGSALLTVNGTGAEPAHKNGPVACKNFLKVAEDVKAKGIRLITIGFAGAARNNCDEWNSKSGGNAEYQKCPASAPSQVANPNPRNYSTYPNNTTGNRNYNNAVTAYNNYLTQLAFWTQSCPARKVRDVLAEAASPGPDGQPATAEDCDSTLGRARENSDGDDFFCGVNGSEFAEIFQTAFGQMTTGVRLLRMPTS